MSTLFISYSTRDRPAAAEMYRRLTAKGYQSPFLDYLPESGIPAGTEWERNLYRNLKLCKALIVLCSENWRQSSQWCFVELGYAKSMGKPIFPVKIAPCDVSSVLAGLQVIDLHGEGETAYERLWRGLEEARLAPQDDFGWQPDRPPYPGLMVFEENDAAVYFGRDKEIQEVLDHLNQMRSRGEPRLLMVVGASGSGKSSLVRAGVLPRMKFRESCERWLVMPIFRWNELRPLGQTWPERLALDLINSYPDELRHRRDWKALQERISPSAANDTMQPAAERFIDETKELLAAWGGRDIAPILVLDQFEELLGQPADGSSTNPATMFLRFLRKVLVSERCPWLCMSTVRSDFHGAIQMHPELVALPRAEFPLDQMPKERFYDVIRRPAESAAITFESDALVDRIVQDTGTNDALPLLAFALRELYDRFSSDGRFTEDEYRNQLGGLEGCLRRVTEELLEPGPIPQTATAPADAIDPSNPAVEKALRLCFVQHLAQINERGDFVRRTGKWNELPEAARPLLERFVDKRLLTSRGEGDERVVEVAHEALFRVWDKLAGWLKESRDIHLWRLDVQRDQTNDRKWAGLRPAQLAVARHWPKQRPQELTPEEKSWIRSAIWREHARRGVVATVVLVITVMGAIAWWQNVESRRRLITSYFQLGESEIREGRLASGQFYYWQAYNEAETFPSDPRGASARNLIAAWGPVSGRPLLHAGRVSGVAFSPDGQTVLTGSLDRTARLWDVLTGQPKGDAMTHDRWVRAVAFSPDGRSVLTQREADGQVRLWDSQTGQPRGEPLPHGDVSAVAFSQDGTTVLTGSADTTARLWDTQTGQPRGEPLQHGGGVNAVAFSPDGKLILTGSADKTARLWNAETGQPRGEPLRHDHEVHQAAFSHDGNSLLTMTAVKTVSRDGSTVMTRTVGYGVQVWDTQSGEARGVPIQLEGRVDTVAFSLDDQAVLTLCSDGKVRVWDSQTGQMKGEPFPEQDSVRTLAISPDGTTLLTHRGSFLSASDLWFWDIQKGQERGQRLWHEDTISAVTFSSDGKRLVTGSRDNTARIWEVQSRDWETVPLRHEGESGWVTKMVFSADGESVLTSDDEGAIQLWNARTGELRRSLERGATPPVIAFSPTGDRALTVDEDGRLRFRDARTWQQNGELPYDAMIAAAVFSPDGRTVITGGWDNTARLWDVSSLEPRGKPMRHEGDNRVVEAVAFSPDGQLVLTGGQDSTARLWDASNCQQLGDPLRHESTIVAVAFGPDGQTMVTASYDKTARLWSVPTHQPIGEPLWHDDQVLAVAFSPLGQTVVTDDGTMRLWDAQTGQPLGDPIPHDSYLTALAFSPDGETVLAGDASGTVGRWKVPPPAADEPERLRLSIEVRTLFTADSEGNRRRLTQAEWLAASKKLTELGGPCDVRSWDQVREAEE